MQLNLFTPDRLPHHPHCSDNLGNTQIRCVSNAMRRRYIQPNAPVRRYWFVYDVDREGAALAWENVAAEPNFSVINPANGHAHLLYCLDVPIYLEGKARIAPINYAAAVQAAYTDLLGADVGYQENLCKNPLHEHWRVREGCPWAYDLDELASWIPADRLTKYKRRKRTMQQGIGRNCTLFDTLRTWAYQNINKTAWISKDAWFRAIEGQAQAINGQFPVPLPFSEVKATARSVAKWVWKVLRGSQAEYIAETHTSEIQAARGRKSGESRRKGTPLENDPEPWKAEGVSRATWYRRQQKTLFDSGSDE